MMSHVDEQAYLLDAVRKYFNHPEQVTHYSSELVMGLTSAEQYLLDTLPTEGVVLDVGCGAGRVSVALAEKGYSVTAIDVSEELLSVARQNALDRKLDIKFL